MTRIVHAFRGAQIHDGQDLHRDRVLAILPDDRCRILAPQELPPDTILHDLPGGTITPGFVDLQVNGGGGVMFNDHQSVTTLRKIAVAHGSLGSAAILPTLITDTPERTRAAIDAVEQAIEEDVRAIIGIHLEGPHLSQARKGAHDPALIRPMEDADLRMLLDAAERLANVMVTVAPESVTLAQIRILADAGVTVSLGHTDAAFDTCLAAFDAGARAVTHLFNAMSQLGSRAPGLVGATLARGDIYAGLIADGIHVHPASIRAALAAKPQAERVFLVTDAMATGGSDIERFLLNGREILRRDQRLTLADGTLAGADLDISRALSVMTNDVGDTPERAIARATRIPTELLRAPGDFGRLVSLHSAPIHLPGGGMAPILLSDLMPDRPGKS